MKFIQMISRSLQHVCSKCPSVRGLNQRFVTYNPAKFYVTSAAYKYIITELVGSDKNIGLVRFNRLQARHAFSTPMLTEIAQSIADYDDKIRAIIITGTEKVFSSGGDIKEVTKTTYPEIHKQGFLNEWENILKCRTPIIAAVNGIALGGGFEFALSCDIIYASEAAKFCLPEGVLGTICMKGAPQKLARSVSKTNVMEMVLSAKVIDAYTAERIGFISKVCPHENLLEECITLAEKISSHCPLAVQLGKKAVNNSYETTLQQGLELEKLLLHAVEPLKNHK